MTIHGLQQQFNLLVAAWQSERLAWAHHSRQRNVALAMVSRSRMTSLGLRAINVQRQIGDLLSS
jgi:hypothetical protein